MCVAISALVQLHGSYASSICVIKYLRFVIVVFAATNDELITFSRLAQCQPSIGVQLPRSIMLN